MAENDTRFPGFDALFDKNLKVEIVRTEDSTVILKLSGYIDTYNTGFLNKKVNMVISRGFINVVFDMKEITYMSSTGIGCFTSFLRYLKPLKGDFVLVGIQPKVMEIFVLIGFVSFFKFSSDVNHAVSLLESSERRSGSEISALFPKIFKCKCSKKLKASKPGKFRCPQCKTVISVNPEGKLKIVLG